mgnify:CR=1 FL=1
MSGSGVTLVNSNLAATGTGRNVPGRNPERFLRASAIIDTELLSSVSRFDNLSTAVID